MESFLSVVMKEACAVVMVSCVGLVRNPVYRRSVGVQSSPGMSWGVCGIRPASRAKGAWASA